MKFFRLLLLSLVPLWSSFAAELHGTVTDYSTGRPVAGVIVRSLALQLETASDVKGTYVLRGLPVGTHVVSYLREGYAPYSFEQTVADAARAYGRNVELRPLRGGETSEASLREEPRYLMPEVEVLTTRARSDYPVTFENLSRADVQQRNYGQDLPLLLTELPNVTSYSDGGSGLGYSYLRMRGFGQNRVAVQINGTPLNDAGSHEVFWIDLPDFAEDIHDIQVQRGIGSSLYGPAAFGGTINIVTRTPGLETRPALRVEGTYGSWNTRRAMAMFESGRIQNRYGITGRLTRMESDGYRFGSWTNLWSYYLSGAYFSRAHTTRLVFYGGPERTHLSYEGVTRDHLEGRITGDRDTDRRFNPITYSGEIDNFFQPHYELHDEWRLNDRMDLFNTLYVFRGDGYYDQWRPGQRIFRYFFDDSTGGRFDVMRRRNVGETDGGWIPRLTTDHRFGSTTAGAELRLHRARHEGLVLWGNPLPEGAAPDHRYYDYGISRQSYAGYVHNMIDVAPRLRAMADLMVQSTRYELLDDRVWNVTFDRTFTAVSPRVGLNYQLLHPASDSRAPMAVVYGNVSWAQREPTYKDIYDPQDYGRLPVSDPDAFAVTDHERRYTGPGREAEKLTNVEIGTQWQWRYARIGLNYYYMPIRDELVPWGTINDLGVAVTAVAERTLHQGVEVVAAVEPVRHLAISGNLALTDHKFVRYDEWDWSLNDGDGGFANRDGNRLAVDPAYVANLRVGYSIAGIRSGLSWRTQGKQFIDNTEDDGTSIPAYSLLNLDLAYRFPRFAAGPQAVELSLRINNLLNEDHETFGFYSDAYDGWDPVYIVGAPRAAYLTLGVEL